MKPYCKIQTVFKRDPETKFKTLLEGDYSIPAFEYLKDNEWMFTEKIDGTNSRVCLSEGRVTFGGRTDNSQIPAFLILKLMELFPAEKMAEVFPDGEACLYGEGYGAKIQKGGGNYISDGCGFILFDVMCGDWWLERDNIEDVANKLGIPVVPIIGHGTLLDAVERTREGFKSIVGDCIAEGIVMRPDVVLYDRNGKRILSKIKNKDFKGV
ncbi:MAG TPA: RNA ligase family protein [Alphaproteobacteria bacterium]|nr:RNA ligase family protein [Alphaproteobacteria bacterium]